MKITVKYDEHSSEEKHYKIAITLPSKWLGQTSDKVKELFVERYNKKYPDNELDDEDMVLAVKDNSPFTNKEWKYLSMDDTPEKAFAAGGDVYVKLPPKVIKPGMTASGKLSCKNFGCQMEYDEADNHDQACCHHTDPPIFHDTRKWWGCCPEVKVFEFDELLAIPGCMKGRHRNEVPKIEIERKAALAKANAEALAMHERAEKPNASGVAPAPKQNQAALKAAPPPKPKVRPKLPPGVARCKHYGCQADFKIAENHARACCYHTEPPYFHEGGKKWTCCGVTKYDFDDFLAVPGCKIGPHEEQEYDDDKNEEKPKEKEVACFPCKDAAPSEKPSAEVD